MTQGLALRSPRPDSHSKFEPRLRLLVELEPGYRVFFRNLLDLILRRREAPLFLASQPVHCSRHFYLRTGVRWTVVLESIAWHLVAVPLLLVLWTWSLKVDHSRQQARLSRTQEQITYYAPDEAFPARAGRQNGEFTAEHVAPSSQPDIKVAAEQRSPGVEAPNVTVNQTARSEIAASNPALPAVPLSATARSRLVLPDNFAEAIAPAPDAGRLSMSAIATSGASVVAPPPQVAGLRRGGGISLPTTVVAPAPAVQGSARMRSVGGIDIGSGAAVPPSPQLAIHEQRAGSGVGIGSLGASGVVVVPPAPSIRGQVFLPGGSGNSGSGSVHVVPPSPSLGHGLVLAGGRGNSLAGAGTQVVPPAPAIRGQVFRAGGGGNSIGGLGSGVVPPPPSIGRAGVLGGGGGKSFADVGGSAVPPSPLVGKLAIFGGNGGRSGAGSLTGDGVQVVAPAPSLASSGVGSGSGGNGGNALAGFGSQVLPPSGSGGQGGGIGGGNAPSGGGSQGSSLGSAQGAGSGGGSGSLSSGAGKETVAGLGAGPVVGSATRGGPASTPIMSATISHTDIPDVPAGKTEVLPLRVIQLALALPMTSYFSNYEAFVAERSVNRNTTQLIKLVYIFLPYQRRLTEFGVNTSKTFNLRVTRDPSCDESLLSMTWTEGEAHDKPQPTTADHDKTKLPCYRTTADDYRKAWGKAR